MLTYIPLARTVMLFNSQSGLYYPIPVAFTLVKAHDTLPKDFYSVGNNTFIRDFYRGIKPIGWYYYPIDCDCSNNVVGYRYLPRFGSQLRERISQHSLADLLTSIIECDSIEAITFVHEDIVLSSNEKQSLPRNFKMECV